MARGLLGLLLLFQLAGFHASGLHVSGLHGLSHAAPVQPDLAELSAAIGQPVAICKHDGDPTDQGAPDQCCPSCSLCHMLAGVAILPPNLAVRAPVAIVAATDTPRAADPVPRPRLVAGASSRGPPLLV